MVNTCAVVGCGNRAKRDKKSFFRFPAIVTSKGTRMTEVTTRRRQEWFKKIKLRSFKETYDDHDYINIDNGYLRVCSDHFISGKPAEPLDVDHPDWTPSQNLGYSSPRIPDGQPLLTRHEHLARRIEKKELEMQAKVHDTGSPADPIDKSDPDWTPSLEIDYGKTESSQKQTLAYSDVAQHPGKKKKLMPKTLRDSDDSPDCENVVPQSIYTKMSCEHHAKLAAEILPPVTTLECDTSVNVLKENFDQKLCNLINSLPPDSNAFLTSVKYISIIQQVKEYKTRLKNEPLYDDYLKLYDVISEGDHEKLTQPTEGNTDFKLYVTNEELFDVLYTTHLATNHGGKIKMQAEFESKYCNITEDVITIFLSVCLQCQDSQGFKKKTLVKENSELMSRCHIDFIDMESRIYEKKRYILVYEDFLTKFVLLKALEMISPKEVAYCLLDIFSTIGAPMIIHSGSGHEFINHVIKELCNMWKDFKVVQGQQIKPVSVVENVTCDIEDMLSSWMLLNKTTNWLHGLKFIQMMKNVKFHKVIKKTPYEAMFGCKAKFGLDSLSLPQNVMYKLKTEANLLKALKKHTTLLETKNSNDTASSSTLVSDSSSCSEIEAQSDGNIRSPGADRDAICIVCLKECQSSHFCNICKESIHDFCGKIDEEMESCGAVVTCYCCLQKMFQ